jgi:hypothetical protein
MQFASNAAKDQMIKILQSIESVQLRDSLIQEIGTGDTHLDATIYKALFHSRDLEEKSRAGILLNHEAPRMICAGIYGVLRYPVPELFDRAIDKWNSLLSSTQKQEFMPALELLIPEFKAIYLQPPMRDTVNQKLRQMLQHDDSKCIKLALEILSSWPPFSFDDIEDTIMTLANSSDWSIRSACMNTSHLLTDNKRKQLLYTALEDKHPNVRTTAINILATSETDDIGYIKDLIIDKHTGSMRATKAMLEYMMNAGADATTMSAISLSLAEDARNLKRASIYLKNSDIISFPEVVLLNHALTERIVETIDLALFAIQTSSHEDDIAVIRAALHSNDRRQFAYACELITMLNNRQLAEILVPLFDDSHMDRKSAHATVPFDNIHTLLTWIENRADPWLSECTNYLSARLNTEAYV